MYLAKLIKVSYIANELVSNGRVHTLKITNTDGIAKQDFAAIGLIKVRALARQNEYFIFLTGSRATYGFAPRSGTNNCGE
jgi:hypothetical protein